MSDDELTIIEQAAGMLRVTAELLGKSYYPKSSYTWATMAVNLLNIVARHRSAAVAQTDDRAPAAAAAAEP